MRLDCSRYWQAIVLLLFNEAERYSFADVLAATSIEEKELKLTLQSLACGKQRVLRKEPKGRDVDDTDEFFYEASFKVSRILTHVYI